MMKKISNRELEERVNRAVDNFMQGYGCCQSVLAAFCDLYGMDETLALKVAAGFGGGVGRLRMMCGAVLPNTIRRVPALPKWRARHASLRSISARNIPKRRYSLSVA